MTIKDLIQKSNMTITEFAAYFHISYRTVQDWNAGRRTCSDYLIELMHYKLLHEGIIED